MLILRESVTWILWLLFIIIYLFLKFQSSLFKSFLLNVFHIMYEHCYL